ncbi:MAG: hypothetical protein Q7T55_12440 [Solirubrobacteraceae bacterium]|nr:hypothetical protein [Solirubrobacteraceae bacterium]
MPRVVVADEAVTELRRIARTHSLPSDTHQRVARSASRLQEFPELGPALAGSWSGYRFLLGPWSWMVLVYEVVDPELVVVVTIQDARSSSAATGSR